MEDMQQSSLFQQEDDGRTPLFLLRLEGGLEEGEGVFACATNESFARSFRPALALVDDVVAFRALESLLLAA